MSAPLLWILVGPNGAGKTTYYERYIRPRLSLPFINADLIASAQWPGDAANHSYEAARLAAETRRALMEKQRSFVTETVFSHPSKLDLLSEARERGYLIWLTCIYLDDPELAVARVSQRIDEGGHAVPPEKIRQRYARMIDNVRQSVDIADRVSLIDNSYRHRAYQDVVRYESGGLVWVNPSAKLQPAWARRFIDSVTTETD